MKNKWLKTAIACMAMLILLTACGKTATEDNYKQQPAVTQTTESKTESETKEEPKQEKTQEQKAEETKPEDYGDKVFQVVAPAGVPTIGLLKMMKENQEIEGAKMAYETIVATDTLAPKLISGEADFAIVPANLAIKVYNKGAKYQYAGSTVWGVLYLVSGDAQISAWQELKGKKITLIGRGLTPDLTLRYLMKQNGLDPEKDVTFEYVSGATELAPMFISGKAEIALLPEPMLTQVMTKKPETHIAFDIQEEWKQITDGESYPQTAVLVKKEIIDQYPVLTETFLARLLESVEFANVDPQTTGKYMQEIDENMKAEVIAKAIANCNLEYKDADQAKAALEAYYQRLFEFGADNIGGKMPDENFYYQR